MGKSQTTRAVAETLKDAGKRVVAVRHPMPYGDLAAQRVQRYAALEDLDRYESTIEEREEYEPHIVSRDGDLRGRRLRRRSSSRRRPSATSCCGTAGTTTSPSTGRRADRAGRPAARGPRAPVPPRRGEPPDGRRGDRDQQGRLGDAGAGGRSSRPRSPRQPRRDRGEGELDRDVDDPEAIAGKRVLVVEDGPTLTHGEMKIGAGVVAARAQRRRRDRRPAALGDRHDRGDLREVRRRRGAPGDGLQRRASSPRWRRSSTRPTSTSW